MTCMHVMSYEELTHSTVNPPERLNHVSVQLGATQHLGTPKQRMLEKAVAMSTPACKCISHNLSYI